VTHKPVDYSKFDAIEVSDDEECTHGSAMCPVCNINHDAPHSHMPGDEDGDEPFVTDDEDGYDSEVAAADAAGKGGAHGKADGKGAAQGSAAQGKGAAAQQQKGLAKGFLTSATPKAGEIQLLFLVHLFTGTTCSPIPP
jgi:hypothetical protein